MIYLQLKYYCCIFTNMENAACHALFLWYNKHINNLKGNLK
jgi:hypothetical protein